MTDHDGMERRGFLARAIAGLAALGVLPTGAGAARGPAMGPAAQGGWDMSWLDGLTGKHKQVFDLTDPQALRVIRNWLDAYQDIYGLKSPQVNAVIGIAREAFTANASDALYRKFSIGELWKVNDPGTGKPALRNLYLDGGRTPKEQAATVRGLQARGVIFWQCNNALHGIAAMIGDAVKRPEPEVYEELRAGLVPGVIVVPAHTMLLGLCQERGCSYESL
jgi:hypothetical protein